MNDDNSFLKEAFKLARESKDKGLRPFGAILVDNNFNIVMKTYDMRDVIYDPTAHPEIYLISTYCKQKKKLNLAGYTLYSNIEPCSMCSGAIRSSRISKVVFSVPQSILRKYSGGKTVIDSKDILNFSRGQIEIKGSLLLEEGIKIIEDYDFKKARLNGEKK